MCARRSQVNRSHGFIVEKFNTRSGIASIMAGSKQTGWRDGVGEDAHFFGGLAEALEDASVYCETALSSDGRTLFVYDSLIRKIDTAASRDRPSGGW